MRLLNDSVVTKRIMWTAGALACALDFVAQALLPVSSYQLPITKYQIEKIEVANAVC